MLTKLSLMASPANRAMPALAGEKPSSPSPALSKDRLTLRFGIATADIDKTSPNRIPQSAGARRRPPGFFDPPTAIGAPGEDNGNNPLLALTRGYAPRPPAFTSLGDPVSSSHAASHLLSEANLHAAAENPAEAEALFMEAFVVANTMHEGSLIPVVAADTAEFFSSHGRAAEAEAMRRYADAYREATQNGFAGMNPPPPSLLEHLSRLSGSPTAEGNADAAQTLRRLAYTFGQQLIRYVPTAENFDTQGRTAYILGQSEQGHPHQEQRREYFKAAQRNFGHYQSLTGKLHPLTSATEIALHA